MPETPIWCIPLDAGSSLIYAPYHGITTMVNRPAEEELRRCLTDRDAEISAGMEWIRELRKPVSVPDGKHGSPDPLYLGIIPTRACTMQCAYCDFAPERAYPLMTFDTIRHAADGYAELLR